MPGKIRPNRPSCQDIQLFLVTTYQQKNITQRQQKPPQLQRVGGHIVTTKSEELQSKQSRLSSTALAEAIIAGHDDFSRHNPIHRWWGGTELTNDRLWRWDPAARALIAR
jgi:hypothetical protein